MAGKETSEATNRAKAAGHRLSKKQRDGLFAYLVLLWPLLHFLVFWVGMNAGMVWLSFRYGTSTVSYFNGFKNYKDQFRMIFGIFETGINNHYALLNSLSLIPLSLLVNLPITLLFSFAISRKTIGYRFFQIVLFVPAMISATVLCLSFKIFIEGNNSVFNTLLRNIGLEKVIPAEGWLANEKTAWPTMLVFSVLTGISTNIIYFVSSMARVPDSVIESAQLDGASEMCIFRKIALPLVWPTICTMSVSIVAGCFSWYMPSLLMAPTGPRTTSLGLIIISTTTNSGANIGSAAALGVLVAIMGTIVITLVRKLAERFGEEVEY